jgi:hypothetical protein
LGVFGLLKGEEGMFRPGKSDESVDSWMGDVDTGDGDPRGEEKGEV